MSTKPDLSLARFASGGSADRTAPTSGARDVGFVEGDPADQSIVNELIFRLYEWAVYLSDGVFSGDVALNGSLTVGGQLVTFVDFTYTADSSTDRLTRTAHGLQTGYGPVRTSNSGGAPPSGLLAATDYYVIRVDADHLQLAATRTDALAGFAIDFLTNGTGTQTLLHQSSATMPTDAAVSRNLAVTGSVTAGSGAVGGAAFSFPSTVFTANSTTDQLAIDAHGLETGWGPMRVSNSAGALPTGLLAATDYWVIRVNSGKFSLATSFSNAMAGTAIDLTTAGTGTNSIVSGTSPTQAGNVTVHGNLTVDGAVYHSDKPGGFTGTNFVVQSGTATINLLGDIVSSSSCILIASVPLGKGDRLKSISAVFDSATGTVDVTNFNVDRISMNGTATSIGSTTVSNIGAPTPTAIDLTDTQLGENESFTVTVAINAAACSVRNVQYVYDRPPP